MKDERTLLTLDLKILDNKKQEINLKETKICILRLIHMLLETEVESPYMPYIFAIIEFFQICGFLLYQKFVSGWKSLLFGTIGSIFRYTQLFFLWDENNQFYIIAFIVVVLYVLAMVVISVSILVKMTGSKVEKSWLLDILGVLIFFEQIMNIPFNKVFFSVFTCENNSIKSSPDISCKSGFYYALFILSIIFAIIFFAYNLIIHILCYNFGHHSKKIKALYTSEVDVLLLIIKLLMVIIYQFIKDENALAIISTIISLILLIDYASVNPFVNQSLGKLYLCLYCMFFWTSVICLLSVILKHSEFEGGIILLTLGYPIILAIIYFRFGEFSIENVFKFVGLRHMNGYNELQKIEYFLKLMGSLNDKYKGLENKMLITYIENYERTCTTKNCALKQFLNTKFDEKNYEDLKFLLRRHAYALFKNSVQANPESCKLRLGFAYFLFFNMSKRPEALREIYTLPRISFSPDDVFQVFRARLIFEETENGVRTKQIYSVDNQISLRPYEASIIKCYNLITNNYIQFWTILSINDNDNIEAFHQLGKIGEQICEYRADLQSNFDKLLKVNYFKVEMAKLYMQYALDVLNDQEEYMNYLIPVKRLEQKKQYYNENNLYDLNYKEMTSSEEYMYYAVDCSEGAFNKIANMSLSMCHIFGFEKNKIVGQSMDYVMPEIYNDGHKKLLKTIADGFRAAEMKKKKGKEIKSHNKARIFKIFLKNSMGFIIPSKMKIGLMTNELNQVFGFAKYIKENNIISSLEDESVYLITDKDLILRNVTANGFKILNLGQEHFEGNVELCDLISEFRKELSSLCERFRNNLSAAIAAKNDSHLLGGESGKEIPEINPCREFRSLKHIALNRVFKGKEAKTLEWIIGENRGYEEENIKGTGKLKSIFLSKLSKITTKTNKKGGRENRFKSAFCERSSYEIKESELKAINSKYASEISNLNTGLKNLPDLKYGESGDIDDEENKIKSDINKNDKIENTTENFKFYTPEIKKFVVNIDEAKVRDLHVGYVFKFTVPPSSTKQQKIQIKGMNKGKGLQSSIIDNSEPVMETLISFSPGSQIPQQQKQIFVNQTTDNPEGVALGIDNSYVPALEKEDEFEIDMKRKSYRQRKKFKDSDISNSEELLKSEALAKVADIIKTKKKLEESSEDSDSSSEEDEESHENSEENGSLKNEKNEENYDEKSKDNDEEEKDKVKENEKEKDITDATSNKEPKENPLNQRLTNAKNSVIEKAPILKEISIAKHKLEEDYYHVDTSHITYMVFNYSTGFVEVLRDQKFKVSQVTKTMNQEKEKMGKITNAKYLADVKGQRKKRGQNAIKKEENGEELDAYSDKKIKLKEIQKVLNSKGKQKTVVNLCIFSFVIFLMILASSITNIILNSSIKNNIMTYYLLMKYSVTLHRNLLFQITVVREQILVSREDYTNMYLKKREVYFESLGKILYNYFIQNSYCLGNLSSALNELSAESREKIDGVMVNIEVIDSDLVYNGFYPTENYTLNVYSAFRQLNSALYHVSQLPIDDVNQYNDDYFYFIRNSINHFLVVASDQVENLRNEFKEQVHKKQIVILIVACCYFVLYFICYLIFIHFFVKVEERKESYLSVFYEINGSFITQALAKCEKFAKKLKTKDILQGDEVSMNSISNDDSDFDMENQPIVGKKINNISGMSNKIVEHKTSSYLAFKIGSFIVFFIMFSIQMVNHFYIYFRLNRYIKYVEFDYYNNLYISRYVSLFIGFREYAFNPNGSFFLLPVLKYLQDQFTSIYVELDMSTKNRDNFTDAMPKKYRDYRDDLISNSQCKYLNDLIEQNPDAGYKTCDELYYNSSDHGYFTVLNTYIEEIRTLCDLSSYYLKEAELAGFKYNNTLKKTPYENLYYPKDESEERQKLYNETNPFKLFNDDLHKTTYLIFRFMMKPILDLGMEVLYSECTKEFEISVQVGFIINIIFIILFIILFSGFYLPFVLRENDTIFKTKKMLSIIPKDVLLDLPHINHMLGIEEN